MLALSILLLAAPQQPAAASTAPTCTARWMTARRALPPADRYNRRRADAFGRTCLGITKRVPIDWAAVRADLDRLVPADHPLTQRVPADIGEFCPSYRRATTAERAGVWRELVYEVIKPEAGVDAHAIMWEQPRDLSQGEYSIGLLQLSISNRRPYGCDIPTEASLLDRTRNLACGIRIVDYLIARDERIGGDAAHGRTGLGRYWSTIRVVERKPPASGRRETRATIVAAVRRLPQCRAR